MAFDTRLLKHMPLTMALIVICVIVAIGTKLGYDQEKILPFLITERLDGFLVEVQHGQIWRLLTPALIHFGPLHILFNMMWLFDLGRAIELRQGSVRLGILVGVTAILPNLAQYFWSGPGFGGMSGVVYGLLTYLWAQSQFNPRSGFMLNQTVVWMMLVWFVLCWVGIIPNVANMAHTAGLVAGGILGWLYSPGKFTRRN